MSRSRLLFPTAAALAVLLLVSGCGLGATPHPSASRSATSAASQSTTPSPVDSVPTEDNGVPAQNFAMPTDASRLFTITGAFRSPDGGSRVGVTETVYLGTSTPSADEKSALDAQSCSDLLAAIPKPTYLRASVTSTVVSGKPESTDALAAFTGDIAGGTPMAFAGAWGGAQAPCAEGYATMPGTMTAVIAYSADARPTDPNGWTSGDWGFAIDHNPESDDASAWTTVSCTLDLGPAAKGVTLPASWTTHQACGFGARATQG